MCFSLPTCVSFLLGHLCVLSAETWGPTCILAPSVLVSQCDLKHCRALESGFFLWFLQAQSLCTSV